MLILISGPSCSGKSTIIKQIIKNYPICEKAKSTTTRPLRPHDNESQGNPYFFVSKDEFLNLINQNSFVEYNIIHNNYYGLKKQYFKKAQDNKNCIIVDIDVEGAQKMSLIAKQANIPTLSFYIAVTNSNQAKRFIYRQDDPQNAKLRISRTQYENSLAKNFDGIFVNNDYTDIDIISKCIIYKIKNNKNNKETPNNNTSKANIDLNNMLDYYQNKHHKQQSSINI